ncbi:MAG: CPBP family intramembrane metalloprotease [Caldilineaceae bacterium]|nr:CPBP family intramembrane metalloprotease [Caldilineaceae bacterium]
MHLPSSLIKRYPFTSFVLLTYLFSWWPSLLYLWGMSPIGVAAFGPFLAALVVLAVTEGKPGLKTLLRRIVHWRVGWQWYLVALGLPIVMAGIASYLTVLLGAPVPTAAQLAAWPGVGVVFLMRMLIPGLGGTWEEPGWRGYAVHQLEKSRSRLAALWPLWLVIVLWHVPLFLTGDAEWVDILNMVAGVIIYNWLYHRSGNSVLLVMIIHSMNNAVSGEFFSPMFTGVYAVQQAWMRTLVWSVVAAIVLVVNWRWWTGREENSTVRPHTALESVASN